MNRKWISEKEIMTYPAITEDEAARALSAAGKRVFDNLIVFDGGFPGANSIDGHYIPGDNRGWTTGFWTGELWLAYEWEQDIEKKVVLRAEGERHVLSFLRRIEELRELDHHDMGFLYSPSCVAAYKLTGSVDARRAAILAAEQLKSRFQPVGEFIQAWGAMGEPENYRFIIDCLLNLPLLYWASEETGDRSYRDIAERHIHTAMANVIREDNSTWHTVFMNMKTGEFERGATCQGYMDGSAWARGQAWGIYGAAVAYKYTSEDKYIEYFRRISSYYLNHLPKDLIPYWDLSFGDGDGKPLDSEGFGAKGYSPNIQPRDSSSSLIAVCGFLEMSKYLDVEESGYYTGIAKRLLRAILESCIPGAEIDCNGLVIHGTYSHKSPYNTCTPEGTDECVIWGDYYYMEALTRLLRPEWREYW